MVVATIKIQNPVMMGSVSDLNLEVILESVTLISLLAQDSVDQHHRKVNAKGTKDSFRHIASCCQLYHSFCFHTKYGDTTTTFFVVSDLITPAILELDFYSNMGWF